MAKYSPNELLIHALHGAVGNLVFYKDADGNLILQRKGERTVPPSPKQLARNSLFRLAAAYGNHAKSDPNLVAFYRPFCRGRMRVYHAAVRDFLSPPKIGLIAPDGLTGRPGESLRVIATDDTAVLAVQVVLRNALTSAVLEQGPAQPGTHVDEWLYPTTTALPSRTALGIEVTATDRPGNSTTSNTNYIVPEERFSDPLKET